MNIINIREAAKNFSILKKLFSTIGVIFFFSFLILNETSSGGVCINHSTLHYSNYNLPFGGIGNSGFGKCHGIYGFKEFSNQKSILEQFSSFSPTDLLVPPYNRFKQNLINLIIKYF